jgi:hypothetical protein
VTSPALEHVSATAGYGDDPIVRGALVMEQGRLFMEGPAAEVRTDPRIRQACLGGNIQQTAA